MEKIFIVDAVNYLFRSYYAIGPMTNDKGQSTNALYGFIRSCQKLQKDFSFKYMVIVFDGPDNKRSRIEVFSDYKMHRKGAPEDLYLQFEHAYNFCKMSGMSTLCLPGVEADDTMGSITKWAKEQNLEVFLCTSDKDLYQLVSENVFVLNAHKNNEIIDAAGVEKYLGVRPDQVVDFLAIMGDTSDNIPGLSGFGPKTAASLLKEFGTLDAILAHPEKVSGKKKQETIIQEKDQALLSKKLAELNFSVDIPKDLEFYELKKPDIGALTAFYHEMKFIKLLGELGPLPEVLKKTVQGEMVFSDAPVQYHLIQTEEDLHQLVKLCTHAKEICVDTETTGEHVLLAKLVGVGLGFSPNEAYYIPMNGELDPQKTLVELKKLFENPSLKFFGHNLKYDYHILKNYDIEIKNISFDTLLASYLINPQHRRHNLDHLSLEFFNKTKISFDDLTQKGKIPLLEVPLEDVKNYCCEDVDFTIRLKNVFEEELKKLDLENVFTSIELPLLPILVAMERHGIFIESSHLFELEEAFLKEIGCVERQIYSEVGEVFNINSPKQLGKILYEKLQLPPPRKKTTEFSTAADVLEKLSDVSPVVGTILQYRGLQKLLSTYIQALPKQVNPNTHRIHATFSQSIASTGRLTCQDPNLQNIPLHSEGGEEIRKAFRPEKKGWSYLSSDYSQIELRLLAHFTEDPKLLYAFTHNQDIHAYTASLIFGVQLSDVSQEMRQMAKTVNFGILYGQGPFGLSQLLHIPLKKAQELIEHTFAQFEKVKPYLEESIEMAKKTGYATTLFGRKRPILEIHNKNPAVRAAAERLAINTPLQGSAADLIKLAMIQIDQKLQEHKYRGFLILQIHDELLFELPDEEIPLFKKIVRDNMENIIKLKVPLVVNMEIGKNWGEC